ALDRDARPAATGVGLRSGVRPLEPLYLGGVVLPRRVYARVPLQHGHEHAARAGRRRESLAVAHTRMAGLLAAAGVQLRRDPTGGGESVRVRRPRCTSRRPERGSRRNGSSGALMHLLVVANETVTGRALIEA